MPQHIHGSIKVNIPTQPRGKIVGRVVKPKAKAPLTTKRSADVNAGIEQKQAPKNNKDLIPKDPDPKDDKLNTSPTGDDKVLLRVSGVFPYQLFPDKVIIDKYKVTIVRGDPLFKRIFPIAFDDIQTVRVNNGIFFSAMEFEVRGFDRSPSPVTHLRQSDAKKAAELILKIISIKKSGGKI